MSIKKAIKRVRAVLLQPIYRFYHSKVPVSSYIRKGTIPKYSEIGQYCWINRNVGLNQVRMGNYCSIASQVLIGGMEHPIHKVSTSTLLNNPEDCKSETTIIGHNVWVGSQSVIRQGVHIGNGAVVGAHSFVNKDVPPYAIVVGSPAKVLRFRFEKDVIDKIEESHFWEYNPREAKQIINKIKVKKG
jgi:acetyltransferase-like isoleucine patch superfamily enzyme